jgi:hypothetical protein
MAKGGSRETKFGYGFLFAGAGLPYLIDKLFGPIAALIAAALCLLAGIAFLIAGHLDREGQPRRSRSVMATIGMFAIIGAASGALVGSISGAIWSLSRKGGTPSPSSSAASIEVSPSPVPLAETRHDAQGRTTLLMPVLREMTIPAMVLINLGPGPVIPPMRSSVGGDFVFYALVEGLSRAAFEPLFKGSTTPPLKETFVLPESDRPRTREAGAHFAVELFQYALFRAIDLLQHSSTEFVKGSHRTATVPPEAIVYPSKDLAAAVNTNRFSRVGQEPMLRELGWQVRVPKDTTIVFTQQEGDSLAAPTSVVEFRNPSLYLLRVLAYVGTIYNPVPNDSALTAYELMIKGYFEFKRKADTDPFQQGEYEKWAMEVFAGLQQMVSKVGSRALSNPEVR